MPEEISSFRSLRTGSQVFAFLMLFLCVSESQICVFRELCPVSLLAVGVCLSALPSSVVMSHVNCGDDGQVVRRQCVPSCLRCPIVQCWTP